MAKEIDTVPSAEVIGYADDPTYQWDTVHTEAGDQLVFEESGDKYIGVYAGHDIIYPEPTKEPLKYFAQLHWTDPQGSKFTNAGYELEHAYLDIVFAPDGTIASHTDKILPGSMTRNEMRKTVDVGRNDPMKSFRVDILRSVNGNASNPER